MSEKMEVLYKTRFLSKINREIRLTFLLDWGIRAGSVRRLAAVVLFIKVPAVREMKRFRLRSLLTELIEPEIKVSI